MTLNELVKLMTLWTTGPCWFYNWTVKAPIRMQMHRLIVVFTVCMCPKIHFCLTGTKHSSCVRITKIHISLCMFEVLSGSLLYIVNPCSAEPGYTLPLQTVLIQICCLLKKSADFRSQLICICTVCHSVCEFISTILIKYSDWLTITNGCGIFIYSVWQVLIFYKVFMLHIYSKYLETITSYHICTKIWTLVHFTVY